MDTGRLEPGGVTTPHLRNLSDNHPLISLRMPHYTADIRICFKMKVFTSLLVVGLLLVAACSSGCVAAEAPWDAPCGQWMDIITGVAEKKFYPAPQLSDLQVRYR
jgi:hypothetical protein